MSIRTKVISCLWAVLTLFVAVTTHTFVRSRQATAGLSLISELLLPLSRQVGQLQSSVQSLSEDMRRYYFSSGAPTDSSFSRMVRDFYPYLIEKRFALASQLLSKNEGQASAVVADASKHLAQAKAAFSKLIVASEKNQYEASYRVLKESLNALTQKLDSETQRLTQVAQTESRDKLFSGLILSSLVGILGVLAILISYRALSPLPQLIASIRQTVEGDFKEGLKIRTSDKGEVASLAREYNRMLEALRERDERILKQQKELLQSERLAAIGQLSAEIVHEIRNPLNSISLNIDWLESEMKADDEEIGKTLRSVAKEVQRLHQITESYLIRARVPREEGQKTPVNDLLREILDFAKEENRAKSIEVVSDYSKEEIYVKTDRARLKQAFLNIINNAKEAMPRGGKLLVRSEIIDNVYRVQFSDSGYGMNEAMRRQVFQPFFTTKTGGTGIGLMLTKNIAEEANGTLCCDSQLGEGTTFIFSFPA